MSTCGTGPWQPLGTPGGLWGHWVTCRDTGQAEGTLGNLQDHWVACGVTWRPEGTLGGLWGHWVACGVIGWPAGMLGSLRGHQATYRAIGQPAGSHWPAWPGPVSLDSQEPCPSGARATHSYHSRTSLSANSLMWEGSAGLGPTVLGGASTLHQASLATSHGASSHMCPGAVMAVGQGHWSSLSCGIPPRTLGL